MVRGFLARLRPLVLVVHGAALCAGLVYAWLQMGDVAARWAAVDLSRNDLARLDARLAAPKGSVPATRPSYDPFLAGPSITVAGANLQDLIVSAIRAAGGTVTSSQVEAGDADTTPAPIQLTVTCQLDAVALQGLLYRLESGTPAVFFEQLSIDAASAEGGNVKAAGGLLRMSLTVSAYWAGQGRS